MTTTRVRRTPSRWPCSRFCAGLGAAHAAGPLDDPGFAKVITCAACHGQNGNSRSDMMPIIAGLDPAYFKRQIENYAAGKRPSPEMEPYAKEIQFLGLDADRGVLRRAEARAHAHPRRRPTRWPRARWRRPSA